MGAKLSRRFQPREMRCTYQLAPSAVPSTDAEHGVDATCINVWIECLCREFGQTATLIVMQASTADLRHEACKRPKRAYSSACPSCTPVRRMGEKKQSDLQFRICQGSAKGRVRGLPMSTPIALPVIPVAGSIKGRVLHTNHGDGSRSNEPDLLVCDSMSRGRA